MKDNFNTRVLGTRIILVPFRKEHAALYLKWMQDPFILEMTASEDLDLKTIEQAEEHQNTVLEDNKNCTFLIAERLGEGQYQLVGDINFFLAEDEDNPSQKEAEVNIMIGESESRRKGLGKEALLLGFRYVIEHLHATSILARISDDNVASITLFKEKLQWTVESHSDVFSETSFRKESNNAFKSFLEQHTPDYRVTEDYEDNKVA